MLAAFGGGEGDGFAGAGGPDHAVDAAADEEIAFAAEGGFVEFEVIEEGRLHDDEDALPGFFFRVDGGGEGGEKGAAIHG